MDLNMVVIAGRLAAKPELRIFDSGQTILRLLVTTRTEAPRRRIDVIPVVMWQDDSDITADDIATIGGMDRGERIWVAGAIQRRFWSDNNSRRSRIEVVARHVQGQLPESEEEEE